MGLKSRGGAGADKTRLDWLSIPKNFHWFVWSFINRTRHRGGLRSLVDKAMVECRQRPASKGRPR